ncbi:DNA adenine methylase [Nostoc sp. CHAB 5715]|uniref:DNA adenine methylase n=1 Tax=Nostoc sp. CHAB 5715 TaxID=2780400 RepID=UPI001E2EFB14|nr:DNA adenine methylase [Nostoc sp. CHAB 5715]MCC5623309.1 DNA adenine methylase [Nostoc sp. CHAB 5715]
MLTQVHDKSDYRPFLKWAGGKSKLIHKYIKYLPQNIDKIKRYYEPFLGSGALFFYLVNRYSTIKSSYLTDINEELINTYQCIQKNLDDVILLLQEHEKKHNEYANYYKNNGYKSKNSKEKNQYYYKVRDEKYDSDIERASRLIYLNRTCFNGLYRVNSQGTFNVPLGRYENPKICQIDLLGLASQALSKAEVKTANFKEVLDYANSSDDFVYFDPPYHPISKTSYFTAYNPHCFSEDDQKTLRDICATLASRGVKVMVSNSHCKEIADIYREIGFQLHTIQAPRTINSNIKNRGMIYELLITSFKYFYLPKQ